MLESIQGNNLEYKRLSQDEMQSRGILGRLVGICADIVNPTRNGRKYSEQLWEQVFDSPLMKERIENGVCYGELGHPADREETDMEKIAVCLAEIPKKGKDGKLRAVFDILDTPNGRILKSLCDYGSTLGISSRGSGDLITDYDGQEAVNPDTYHCEGFDIVLLPAVKEARLQYVTESLNKTRYRKTLRDRLQESINKETEDNKKIMLESLHELGIDLDEEVTVSDRDWRNWTVGEKIKFIADEFDGYSEEDCVVVSIEDDHAIISPINDSSVRYWIDDDLLESVNESAEFNYAVVVKDSLGHESSKKFKTAEEARKFANSQASGLDVQINKINNEALVNEGYSSNVYIAQLPDEVQLQIKQDLITALTKEGYSSEEIEEILENAMSDRLVNLEDCIDIQPYLNLDTDKIKKFVIKEEQVGREETIPSKPAGEVLNTESGDSVDINISSEDGAVDDDKAIIEELQKALMLNRAMDKEIGALKEQLSVSYAKGTKLQEENAALKERIAKLSKSKVDARALSEKLEAMQKKVEHKDSVIAREKKKVTESVSTSKRNERQLSEALKMRDDRLASLNEKLSSVESERDEYALECKTLEEQYTNTQKDLTQLKEQYSKKLERQNTLIERYQQIAKSAVNRYVKTQADMLGIRPVEIRNRLPENYTFEDIDQVCEDLREYKLNVSSLPFNVNRMNEGIQVTAKNVSKGLIPVDEDTEVTDYDLRIAGLI